MKNWLLELKIRAMIWDMVKEWKDTRSISTAYDICELLTKLL